MSIVVSVAALPENVFLIARGPSCLMPQVIQMEVCLWLFGAFEGLLDSTAPYQFRHHVMSLDYERPVIENVFPSEVILFIKRISVH